VRGDITFENKHCLKLISPCYKLRFSLRFWNGNNCADLDHANAILRLPRRQTRPAHQLASSDPTTCQSPAKPQLRLIRSKQPRKTLLPNVTPALFQQSY